MSRPVTTRPRGRGLEHRPGLVHGARVTTTRQRLARIVLSRRNELGMKTQTALADAAGISRASINAIENGKKVSPNVMSLVEIALQWAPGSVDAILDGGNPQPRTSGGAAALTATGTLTAEPPVDLRKASKEELAALFMDMAKDHSDAELMAVMARVIELRSQEVSTRDVS